MTILLGFTAILIFFCLEETAFPRHLFPVRTNDASSEVGETYADARLSYASRLKLWTRIPQAPGETLHNMLMPLRLALEPIVIYCGFLYGLAITCLSIMSVTAVTVFQNPHLRYNFSFSDVGLTNFGTFIGSILVLYIGGAGTDRFMIWKAKSNNGIMEPESRLYAVLVAGPLMSTGFFMYGIGAYNSDPWIVLVVGMAFVRAGLPIAGEVGLGYVSESYPSLTGEATTAVILIRNCIGCGMTFAIQPWVDASGLKDTFIAVGVIALVIFYSGIIFIWKGKACRRRSAKVYLSAQ